MKTTTLTGLLAAAVLCGCAAPMPAPRPKPAPVAVTEPTPQCITDRECEAMWLQAQETVQLVTRMRLRMVTDQRIETFAALNFSSMTGTVLKRPLPGAERAYAIELQLSCYRGGSSCDDLKGQATNLFNQLVAGLPQTQRTSAR